MSPNQINQDQIEGLKIIIPAATGLLGVLIGIVVTTISNWKLRTKEAKLRMIEKTFDKRINAHEDVLRISELLRTTISTYTVDKGHNLITYPGILHNHEYFDDLLGLFYDLANKNTHWISIDLFREINFIQDYFASLVIHIKDKSDEVLPKIALIIKQDIIELAGNLERLALTFFNNDLPNLKKLSNSGWHKYDTNITEERLKNYLLGKNLLEIKKI